MPLNLGNTEIRNVYLSSTLVNEVYLGSTKVWPFLNPFFIGGLSLSQSVLEARLTGETLRGYATDGTNTFATSSTNYTINNSAFKDNPITSYVDQGSCVGIGIESFRSCTSLITANFPSASSIGGTAFLTCTLLTTADFPNVTTIDLNAFSDCISLSNINFPKTTVLNNSAFSNCNSLTTANFPSASSLGTGVFYSCNSLVSASFPNATFVGGGNFVFQGSFSDCTSLSFVNLPALIGVNALGGSPANNNVFYNVPNTGTIRVPSFYSSSNSGQPDGDLQYLTTAPRSWTIVYL